MPKGGSITPFPRWGRPEPGTHGCCRGRSRGQGGGGRFWAALCCERGCGDTPGFSVTPSCQDWGHCGGHTALGSLASPRGFVGPGAPGVKPPVPSRKGVALGGETGAGVQLEDPQAGLDPVNRLGGAGRAGTPPGSSRGWGRDSPGPRAGAPTCFAGIPGAGGCPCSFWGARGHGGGSGRVHPHAWVPLGLRGVLCPPQTFLPAMGPEPQFLTPQDPPSPFPAPMHHQNKPLHPKATLSWPPRPPALQGPLWT